MRRRSLVFAGLALLVTSIFVNVIVTILILSPGPIQITDSLSAITPNYRKIQQEKKELEEQLTERMNEQAVSEKEYSRLFGALMAAREELKKTQMELTDAQEFIQKVQHQEGGGDGGGGGGGGECECDHSAYIKDAMDLRKATEVKLGFREAVTGLLIPETTQNLERNVVPITRVDGKKLSYKDFYYRFVVTQTPVVITNYASRMFAVNWTLDHISEHCGDEKVKLKHFDSKRKSWGNLFTDKESTLVKDFIEEVKEGTAGNSYLFDWGLPRHCPSILDSYTVPKYFATDYFQRVPDELWGEGGYKNSWPSLFIGTGDTRSGLHIDAIDSHFWMAMISGRKRWGVVTPDDVPYIYPSLTGSTFEIGDIFDVNVTQFPLVSKAKIWEAIIGAGDIIYVPGGSAHQIRNLETIISISMNYIDSENYPRAAPLLAKNYPQVVDFMESGPFPHGVPSKQTDLPWEEFKSFPRGEVFDIRN